MSTTIITQIIATAKELTSQTIPVIVLQPGIKAPKTNPHAEPRPDGSRPMWVIDDPDQVPEAFSEPANLAVLLGIMADHPRSPLIAVGLDKYKDPTITDKAKELGVTSKAACWIENTGRGGITLIYADPGMNLKRDTTQEGGALDLLTNSLTLIPPSNTNRIPPSDGVKSGGPYSWIAGHSPFDIPFGDLEPPPQALLAWWLELSAPVLPSVSSNSGDTPSQYAGPIPEGQRNPELTRRAGYYHRKLSNDAEVRSIVHGVNLAECKPPLPHNEVEAILRSILPREGAGHFRGVQPAKLEVVK